MQTFLPLTVDVHNKYNNKENVRKPGKKTLTNERKYASICLCVFVFLCINYDANAQEINPEMGRNHELGI